MRIPTTALTALYLLVSSLSGVDGAPILLRLGKVPAARPTVGSSTSSSGGSSGTVIPSTLERLGFQDRLSDVGHGPEPQRLSLQRRPSTHRRPNVLVTAEGEGEGEAPGADSSPALIPLDTEGLTSQVYMPCNGDARLQREGSPHYWSGRGHWRADRLVCAVVLGIVASYLAAEFCSLIYVRLLQYRSGEGSIRLEDDDEKSRLARPDKVEAESFNYRIRAPLPVSFPVPPLPPHRHPGPLFEKE